MSSDGMKIPARSYNYRTKHESYSEWTFAGAGSGALDPSVKYAGTSSYKSSLNPNYVGTPTNTLTRDAFSCSQLRVILWRRHSVTCKSGAGDNITGDQYVRHPGYGDVLLSHIYNDTPGSTVTNDWKKYRVSFWYDSASNTRFARREYWDGSQWVQDGADVNIGSGAPTAGSIVLKHTAMGGGWSYAWYDELEVYTA